MLRKLMKNKLFLMGLLIPLVWQVIYFSIAFPAIKDGNTGVNNLKIAIVNEDTVLGREVAAKLGQVLPFKTETATDLADSLESMNNGDYNMVIHIASDFTTKLQQGGAQISYFINQAAPSMTKQAMERVAISINQTLNETAFAEMKNAMLQNSVTALDQSGLPESELTLLSSKLSQTLNSLQYTPISGDIQKVNNSDGFALTVFPFFIFLTYFVGGIIMAVLHFFAYRSLSRQYSKSKLFLVSLGINILFSLIIPWIVIGIAFGFGISFSLGTVITWLLLAAGFFTFTSLIQMFINWFGIPGMGVAVVLLFPLQLVSSGLMYSREILPAFYNTLSNYLPSTYFGSGMIKMLYGELSVSSEMGTLLLMSAIFVVVSALSLLKRTHRIESEMKAI